MAKLTHSDSCFFRILLGCAIAPDRPGHGVDFDWNGLAELSA